MLIETLLPMGKVDPGLRAPDKPLDIRTIGEQAKLVEECGLNGLMTEETKDDPFIIMALAAAATAGGLPSLQVLALEASAPAAARGGGGRSARAA